MKEIISYGRFQCKELTPHKNQGMEITFIEKGILEWFVEGRVEKIEPGSVFFTLPWQVHGSINPQEPENTIWHVLFHLEKDYPNPRTSFRFPKSFGFNKEEMNVLSHVFSTSERHAFGASASIRNLMPALIGELQSTHKLREAHAVTLLRGILVELKRIVGGEIIPSEHSNRSTHRVRHLIDHLSSDYSRQWTLTEMANYCGIQRTQLSNLFHKLTGGTPMEYLSRIRMEHAKTLLRETDMKVIDIAFECGSSSSQYFASTFRHTTGMTPSAFRKYFSGLSMTELKDWKNITFRTEAEEQARVKKFSSN